MRSSCSLGAMSPDAGISLREITSDNVRAICDLSVAPDQDQFVAPNAVSMAEYAVTTKAWTRAIYADDFNLFAAADGNTVTIVLEGDCNKDGTLSASDLTCVYTINSRDAVLDALNTLPGDLDGNGDVSFDDFLVLSANFGQGAASYADGNIDLMDGVAFADFLILSDNFGKTPGGERA